MKKELTLEELDKVVAYPTSRQYIEENNMIDKESGLFRDKMFDKKKELSMEELDKIFSYNNSKEELEKQGIIRKR